MIQALADGGVKMGLNRDQSLRLAAQSMLVSLNLSRNIKFYMRTAIAALLSTYTHSPLCTILSYVINIERGRGRYLNLQTNECSK